MHSIFLRNSNGNLGHAPVFKSFSVSFFAILSTQKFLYNFLTFLKVLSNRQKGNTV